MKRYRLIMALMSLLLVAPVVVSRSWAVTTSYVVHNSEEQFKEGDANGVLINSRGELSLGYETSRLLEDGNDVWVVNALVEDDQGNLYAGTSGKGYIYRLRQGQAEEIIYGEGPNDQKHVFSLALDGQGRLLAGTGGQRGQLQRYGADGKWEVLFSEAEIRYIWSMVVGPGGRIYLGTGPTGKVMTLDSHGGGAEVLYKAKEKNILCLALSKDGGKVGRNNAGITLD